MVALCAFAATPRATASKQLAELERRLAAVGKKTKTLSGKFVQHKRLRLFKAEVVTKGRLYYRRPDQLRWETDPPDASTLLVVGKRAELRMPGGPARAIDLNKNQAVGVLVGQLLAWLGVGSKDSSLSRWYRVEVKPPADDRGYRLVLTPLSKSLGRRIKTVSVEFDMGLSLHTVRIQHRGGDRSRITFSHLRRNARLPKDLFK